MMEHRAENYECVKQYSVLRGYLEHFNQYSRNNEIPGLLSFFFILGQAAVPYVRIPVGGSNLDPRVSMFWIQDTRTGKSAAYQVIEQVLNEANMRSEDYNSGNDAALVGTLVPDPDSEDRRNPDMIVRPGLLAGRKGLNFDEGSVVLKTGQHNENTTLFLQSALNAAGTGRNILTKHMARDTFSVKSEVSLWITTYPPKGIKEHVLDKGIFQRVLTYWRHWTLDMKRTINHELAEAVHHKPEFEVPFDDVVASLPKKPANGVTNGLHLYSFQLSMMACRENTSVTSVIMHEKKNQMMRILMKPRRRSGMYTHAICCRRVLVNRGGACFGWFVYWGGFGER